MADQPSSSAAKKKREGMKKLFRDLFKRPKSANDSASHSTGVSVSSAFGDHDPVPGKDAGSVESKASGKYIVYWLHLSVIDDDLASLDDNATLNQGMYCSEFIHCRSNGLNPPFRSYRPLPVSKTVIKRSRSARFRGSK